MIEALAPIFVLIVMGYLLRARGLVPDSFWLPAEKLTYFLFFPGMLLAEVARADLGGLAVLPVAGALIGPVLIAGTVLLGLRRHLRQDGPAFTSVFQGAVRPNTYVGLAAASALYGGQGVTLAAIGIATVIPLCNILAVMVLARYGAGNGTSPRAVALALARNPILSAVGLGAALNLAGLGLPPVAGPVLLILSKAALPLGLLAVGAGLDLPAARASGGLVLQSAAVKLVAVPALTLACGTALGMQGLPLTVAILFNALPCSPSAYVMARQMGGDHRLIAGIITVQTGLAALTLPLVLATLHP